jgi:tol-pal system protein YbgF
MSVRARFRLNAICAAGILGLVSIASNVQAGMFDDDEARAQIVQLRTQTRNAQQQIEQRITELEAMAKSRSMIDLFNQVEVLKVEVAKLRGMQEVLNNELENIQKRQRDLYLDTDTRVRKLESQTAQLVEQNKALLQVIEQLRGEVAKLPQAATQPAAATETAPTAASASAQDALAEQRAYDLALNEFRAGKYREAAAGFAAFTRTFARSPLASSAQYWLGNSLFASKDFRGAISAQRTLIAQYPESSKVPDALLNIGSAFSELDDPREARRAWQEVVTKHPGSEAAVKAKQRLGR